MTKDDILQMAHEAGFNWPEVHTTTIEERLERFAALVAAKAAAEENEACAALCREKAGSDGFDASTSNYLADEIRARHNTQKEQSE